MVVSQIKQNSFDPVEKYGPGKMFNGGKSQILSATPFCLLLKQKGMYDGNKEIQSLM